MLRSSRILGFIACLTVVSVANGESFGPVVRTFATFSEPASNPSQRQPMRPQCDWVWSQGRWMQSCPVQAPPPVQRVRLETGGCAIALHRNKDGNAWFLTNSHADDDGKSQNFELFVVLGNTKYPARIVARSIRDDIALCLAYVPVDTVTLETTAVAKRKTAEGEVVWLQTFRKDGTFRSESTRSGYQPVRRWGVQLADDGSLSFEAQVEDGESGGALFDSDGWLVGMVKGVDVRKPTDPPMNYFSWAVGQPALFRFCRDNGISTQIEREAAKQQRGFRRGSSGLEDELSPVEEPLEPIPAKEPLPKKSPETPKESTNPVVPVTNPVVPVTNPVVPVTNPVVPEQPQPPQRGFIERFGDWLGIGAGVAGVVLGTGGVGGAAGVAWGVAKLLYRRRRRRHQAGPYANGSSEASQSSSEPLPSPYTSNAVAANATQVDPVSQRELREAREQVNKLETELRTVVEDRDAVKRELERVSASSPTEKIVYYNDGMVDLYRQAMDLARKTPGVNAQSFEKYRKIVEEHFRVLVAGLERKAE